VKYKIQYGSYLSSLSKKVAIICLPTILYQELFTLGQS
jgi:hypothetical protein